MVEALLLPRPAGLLLLQLGLHHSQVLNILHMEPLLSERVVRLRFMSIVGVSRHGNI